MSPLSNHIAMMDEGIALVGRLMPDLPIAKATLARLLLLVGSDVLTEFERGLKPLKLNDSDFLTLLILFSRGSSTPSELCVYTSQGPTNMTRIANALVERGLVARGPSKKDRRRVLIHITPAGRRFVRQMMPPMFPRLQCLFDGFSATQSRTLDRLLRKLARNLDRLNADAQP